MKILCTGNLGFVGSVTQKSFEQRGLGVIGYDLMNRQDIRDVIQFEEFIKLHQPDRILHLAAIARFADADRDIKTAFETNVIGTKNVAYVSAKYKIPIVYSSTGSVYMPIEQEPPITEEFQVRGNSVYGCTKALGEKYIQHFGQPYIILRYAHLYGKEKRHHGLIGGFIGRIERGLAPTLYGGKQSNDFTYSDDVVEANFLAVIAPWDKWNQAYNIGTGEEITAEDAGNMICEVAKYKGKIEKKEQRTVDPGRFVYDIKKAETMLGFKAKFNFKKGLIEMFK